MSSAHLAMSLVDERNSGRGSVSSARLIAIHEAAQLRKTCAACIQSRGLAAPGRAAFSVHMRSDGGKRVRHDRQQKRQNENSANHRLLKSLPSDFHEVNVLSISGFPASNV